MPVKLTEEFISNLTGKAHLKDVRNLELRNIGLHSVDAKLFQQMPNLEVLDMSSNSLSSIPHNLQLYLLRKLDLSDNKLTDLEFVVQFTELQELYVENNKLGQSDKFIAATLLPQLQKIDKTKQDKFEAFIQQTRDKIEPQIEEEWQTRFAAKYTNCIPVEDFDHILQSMMQHVLVEKTNMNHPLQPFRKYMVQLITDELLEKVNQNMYIPSPRHGRAHSMSVKLSHKVHAISPSQTDKVAACLSLSNPWKSPTKKFPKMTDSPRKSKGVPTDVIIAYGEESPTKSRTIHRSESSSVLESPIKAHPLRETQRNTPGSPGTPRKSTRQLSSELATPVKASPQKRTALQSPKESTNMRESPRKSQHNTPGTPKKPLRRLSSEFSSINDSPQKRSSVRLSIERESPRKACPLRESQRNTPVSPGSSRKSKRQSSNVFSTPVKASPQKRLRRSPMKAAGAVDSPRRVTFCRTPQKEASPTTKRKRSNSDVGSPPLKLPRLGSTPESSRRCKTQNSLQGQVADYDPAHFVRCHFGDREARKRDHTDNDPTDEFTKVWHCVFEPDPKDTQNTTGIVATCGGHSVCLLDCGTGKVLKKYNEPRQQFYTLAWTTVTMENEDGREWATNLLAVGGYNGYIRLLHPEQLVCYQKLGNGRPNKSTLQGEYYITALAFHPEKTTWMFSGASDATVTLWDIGVPKGTDYQTNCVQLTHFYSPSGAVVSMAIPTGDHLMCGCAQGLFVWKIPGERQVSNKKSRNPDMEVILPSKNKEAPCIDAMTALTNDLLACKSSDDNEIYIVRIKPTLKENHQGRAKAQLAATLQWKKDCQEKFISMGFANGMLVCGEDEGNLMLYNLSALGSQKGQVHLHPSRTLLWPDCEIDNTKENEKKMTDVLDKPTPLIVNCSAVSVDKNYIVTGTDNNLVCIWKQAG